jgi:pilus assembly protein CpaF
MTPHELYENALHLLQQETKIEIATLPRADGEDLQSTFKKLSETQFANVDPRTRDRVASEFFGSGPLEPFLEDDFVTEILVNRHDQIWIERLGQIERLEDVFISKLSYKNFLQRLQAEARAQTNLDRPFIDGYWRQFRLHLIAPPLTTDEPHLSLRRHPKSPWTLHKLERAQWAPPEALDQIRRLVKERNSFLIIGGTNSGKTSVLNACLQEVQESERVVCIEDTNEITLPNTISTKLLSRVDLNGTLRNVDLSELLRQSLRMRPDRIVIGEVRGDEARDLLMALSTGHRGGMGSLHAENPKQALLRLEMLVQMGAPQWSLRAIRHLIFFGVQYILNLTKTPDGRRLEGLYKISSIEDNGFCFEPVYQARTSNR